MPIFTFSHPLYLLLGPPLLYGVLWVARHSLAGLQQWRRTWAIGLRCALVLLSVAALAGPSIRMPSDQLAVMFVLDISDSMPEGSRRQAMEWINRASRRAGPRDQAGLVVFGSDAYVEREAKRGLRVQQIHTVTSRDYSSLASAVRLAQAALPVGAQQRVVLISDGNENIGRVVDEALAAASSSIQIDVVPVNYSYEREAFIDKTILPTEVKVGEPFEVRLVLRSTTRSGGILRLMRQGELIAQQRVDLQPGANVVTFRQTLTRPRFYTYEAVLDADSDTLVENNRGLGFVLVRGKPRVLIVEGDAEDGRFLLQALADQSIDVDLVEPSGLPSTLAEFQSYDSIVLSNVLASDLGEETMKVIRSSVRDLGIGLIMIGGQFSFAPGGYKGTPIEEALPVSTEVRKQKVMPVGALAMVLHTCEFADGNRWARETAASMIDVLGERDKVGVLLYDVGERWGIPMVQAQNKAAIKAQLYTLEPGDMPDFHSMVQLAYDGLRTRAADAAVKHIVVISDGDPSPPSAALLQKLRAASITMSTVSVFPHGGGLTTLQEMARRTGGEYYDVKQASEIPRIFLKEAQRVMKPAIIEETFTPRFLPDSPVLSGIRSVPPLLGYVATSPKPGAAVEIAMATPRDDPLLATWRYGIGKAAAFTSDAKNRWAAPWVASGATYRKFWAQLVRWSIRGVSKANLDTAIEIEQRRGRVTVDVVDARGEYVNGLELHGSVAAQEGSPVLRMAQVAPGRYEGEFEAPGKGQYIVALRYQDDKGRPRVYTVGASVPYSPEYRDLNQNSAVLTAVAERTGGALRTSLTDEPPDADLAAIWRHDQRTHQAPRELWPYLLTLAALLVPVDIGIRRLIVTRADLRQMFAALAERLGLRRTVRPAGQAAAMKRLFSAKKAAARLRGEGAEEDETPGEAAEAPSRPAAPQPPPEGGRVVWGRVPEGFNPVSSVPPDPAPAEPPPARPAPPPEPASGDEGGSTSRLLKAKRRARGDD